MIETDYVLVRETTSVCPECYAQCPAVLIEKDGKVIFEKKCPRHNSTPIVLSDSPVFYRELDRFYFNSPPQFYGREPVDEVVPRLERAKGKRSLDSSNATGVSPWKFTVMDEDKRLLDLELYVTGQCNMRCTICGLSMGDENLCLGEPSLEEIRRISATKRRVRFINRGLGFRLKTELSGGGNICAR